jgi:DNA gyrase subunit A
MEVAPGARGTMWARGASWLARRSRGAVQRPAPAALRALLRPGGACAPPPLAALRHAGGRAAAPPAAAAAGGAAGSRRRDVAAAARGVAAPPAPVPEERIEDVELSSEASTSYLAYAMSVIVGRALPDIRDGLKPVHRRAHRRTCAAQPRERHALLQLRCVSRLQRRFCALVFGLRRVANPDAYAFEFPPRFGRRILYAMHDLGLRPNKPFRKCARVVGEVLGKYHPHGDAAVYDTLVRMAQDFVMGEPLVSGHGNFGSLDADPPAAMRYTECKLQPLADAMLLADLSDATAPWAPTFDGAQNEPTVLPARLPNLLLNGSSGIAVGMATNIPPHSLSEVVDALVLLARNPDATLAQLMAVLPAPDFPTGGVLLGGDGLRAAYATGSGSYTLRGKASVETLPAAPGARATPRDAVIITEIPHAGNKATLVTRIAALVNDRTIDGVSDIRDESDRDGMRVVIECKRGAAAESVLAAVFKHTRLSVKCSINMTALVNGSPRSVGLLEILREFIAFRCDVIRKRAAAQLADATVREHVVSGLLIALRDIDAVVAAIRASADGAAAAAALRDAVGLSEEQTAAVLAMPLRRLTGLESGKLEEEAAELRATLADLKDLLAKDERVINVLIDEAMELRAKYGKKRRTELLLSTGADGVADNGAESGSEGAAAAEAAEAALGDAECLITLSERGYIKRLRPAEFGSRRGGAQARNTRGKTAGRLRGDDALLRVLSCRDRDTVLLFSERGRAFALPAAMVPEGGRAGTGAPVPQLVGLAPGEAVTAVLAVPDFNEADSLVMLTEKGYVKRVQLSEFASIRANGLIALKLEEGDSLRFVRRSSPGDALLVASSDGYVVRFPIDDDNLRVMGRTARGVTCMNLHKGAHCISMDLLPGGAVPVTPGEESETGGGMESGVESDAEDASSAAGPWVLLITQRGFGKRVPVSLFRQTTRAKMGVRGIKLTAGRDGEPDVLAVLRVAGLPPSRPDSTRPMRQRARGSASAAESDEEEAEPEAEPPAEEEVVVASVNGVINRCRLSDVVVQSRTSRGVGVIKLDRKDGDKMATDDKVRTATLLPGALAADD